MKLGMIRNACDDAAFRYVKGKGLDFIEACCNFPEEAAAFNARREEIKALVARHALPVLSCGRWNGDGGPLDADGRVREDFLAEAKETISTCAAIGCPVYNCGCNRVEGMSLFRNCAAAIEWFGTLLDFAGPLGVKIAVYNCPWHNFVRDMATWEIVLGELPDLGIKFDASHSIGAGRDYMEELRLWGGRIRHVHVKGALRVDGQYVDDPPAGLDMLPWPSILGMLYKAGYDGGLSIEPHSETWRGDLGERGIDLTIRTIRALVV